MAAVAEFEWPVVAREAELAEIEQCTAMRMSALLVGAPGVGKSSLLDAALERAGRAGADVVRGDRVLGAVRPHVGHRRVVIGIDDVHLADRATFDLAHRMVHRGQALLLATAEPGAALPDGLRRLLVGKRMRRLAVEALDRTGSARMLTARLGGPVAVDTAERFWELTRGNPLILREVAEDALAEGTLRQVDGTWRWSGLRDAPGGRLADLVDLLLGDLDPGERELVSMLALAGTLEAGLPLVSELGEAAESLNARGVLVALRSGFRLSLRLAHPLCEAVVAASLPELTARRLRLRIADAIERTGARRPDDLARVVRVRLGTGALPGPAGLRKAAAGALRGEDHRLAELLCRAVPAAEADAGLLTTLGESLAGQHRHIEAEAVLGTVPQSGPVIRTRALNLAFGLRRLAEAEAAAGTDRTVRALIRLFKDRTAEARALAGSAAGASALSALLQYVSGDSEGALDVLRESRPVALAEHDDVGRIEHHFLTGWITLDARGPVGAEAALGEMRAQAADGGPRFRAYTGLLEARALRGAGRTARAVELLREAAAHGGPADWAAPRPWRIAQLAGAVAESGDVHEAASLLEEARVAQRDAWLYPLMADAVALEEALVTAYRGDREGAAGQALETARRALAAGRRTQGLAALHLAARAGEARAAATLWRDATASAPADHDVRLRHLLALGDDDGHALADVSRRFGALGLLPLAAEAAATAARAHHASGDRAAARAARAASAELVSRCGATPPEWALPAGSCPSRTRTRKELTAREREIVTLAVSLSNQEIADRLVLSVRTVENHLYRAYGKLAVTTRAELAPRLGLGPSPLTRIA
ncbi:LuxR C-terminal-related transcriptional regulator [Streptomyces sp. P9(2023)]|uniref:helix-turn-helix transcriptional regulator n=1 Tax=Streptomyces sp. P9(2023) TaxID=3064394 RepID=UPI0028F3FC6A|nr:LuxR C-terminal-related transcriptional regulator [Streptomyces sp. P9(2023)]MDT9691492.1 LuxR C-terminal-related transcriptional regulator [Streptomyces sp. P9(2023)]